jgi:DNA topoisomerase-1
LARSLVIVESPAKARTINKFLGSRYVVRASMGHVRDLPKSELGVDVKRDFKPTYEVLPSRKKALAEIRKVAESASVIFLATDPDREGEAIGWHLGQVLKVEPSRLRRVLLHEITRKGVQAAFENPGKIDLNMVNAQQARRILDRLVGYKISPLLWEKVRRGLSAGRVQSVALRIICERERAIQAFKPEEYWSITAHLRAGSPPAFNARLIHKNGEKFVPRSEAESAQVVRDLKGSTWKVVRVQTREKKRNPQPPFITSSLQQEASKKLGFSVRKTMTLAQRLYEGLDLGELGTVGLITYMRTDSPRVSNEALDAVREFIRSRHGADFLPERPNFYAVRKAAQEAHEAIRPASMDLPPEAIRQHLDADELKLYTLIWSRFVASQMTSARFDTTSVDIDAGAYRFRATGLILRFSGFLEVYRDPEPAPPAAGEEASALEVEGQESDKPLPPLKEGETLRCERLTPKQHFTQPPPRFTEAMLVRELEEKGIGRPSTYATIIATLGHREYTTHEKKRFVPTELGFLVNDLLVENFGDIMDVAYTARMEEDLDEIEEGKADWVETLRKFNTQFEKDLKRASKQMRNVKTEETPTDQACSKCGKPMVIKWGRYGKFMACSGYPGCRNTQEVRNGNGNGESAPAPEIDEKCERCGKPMVVRRGRYGPFLACSGYPACNNTRRIRLDKDGTVASHKDQILDEKCPLCGSPMAIKHGRFGEFTACSRYPECRHVKLKEVGVACPRQGCGGQIVERKSRRGKAFFGCSKYPECKEVWWNRPVAEPCPDCRHPFLLEKVTKRHGVTRHCPNEACGYSRQVDAPQPQPEAAPVGR